MKKAIEGNMAGRERFPGIQQEGQTPLVCVSLCGEFQFVWQVPSATEEVLWDSRTSARVLLKLLLCAPGRQAPKSVLAGILWPETDEEKARESLRQASTLLRKMLRTARGEELVEQRNNGEILKLVEQSRLWVDADAFEALVAKASRAEAVDEALSIWQEAYALLTGEFLADDQASEWVRHAWVKRRKQALWMARCRLIRHLADLYLQRGQVSLAEEILEQHLVRFPSDQDALYRLLVLLEQQQCYEQACVLYEQTKRGLDAIGKQPVRQVKACYERIQEAITSHPLLPVSQPGVLFARSESGKRDCPDPSLVVTPVRSHGKSEGSEGAFISSKSQLSSLLTIDGPSTNMLSALRILLEGDGRQDVSLFSRRQFLELGIAAFITQLSQLDKKRITVVDREELGWVLGKGIADGWKLFLTTANAEVLAVSQFQLALIHQAHTLLYPLTRSYLYAGAYGLVGLALHHQERNEEALHAYHNAHMAAVATGDPWYVAQSLICQSDTYLTLGMYAEALQVIEEALHGLSEIDKEHRRARAHLLGCWADVAMTTGEYSFAQKKLDEAAHYFDETTVIEEFDHSCWLQLAGKKALMAGDYNQAVDHLEVALATNPSHWLLRQAGILTPLAIAYARKREREKSLVIAQQAIPVIGTVNASMINKHFLEYVKHDMLDQFPRDSKSDLLLTEIQRQLPHLLAFVMHNEK